MPSPVCNMTHHKERSRRNNKEQGSRTNKNHFFCFQEHKTKMFCRNVRGEAEVEIKLSPQQNFCEASPSTPIMDAAVHQTLFHFLIALSYCQLLFAETKHTCWKT